MLVQLSDPHLVAGADGDGRAARLEHAVSRVAALRPRPDAVLISGDLTDVPSGEAYERVHALLAPLGLPLHALAGNHDDRDLLRARFGPHPAPPGAPVRLAARCGPLRLVGCDSTIPGAVGGALDGEQRAWLAETLAEEPDTPTLLALHHPPVATGVRSMDTIALALEDREPLAALLRGHPQVQAITCGHAHTTMVSAFAGRPLLICPSTDSAIDLDLRDREDIPFAVAPRPLGFAVHTLIEGRLCAHVQPLERVGDR